MEHESEDEDGYAEGGVGGDPGEAEEHERDAEREREEEAGVFDDEGVEAPEQQDREEEEWGSAPGS